MLTLIKILFTILLAVLISCQMTPKEETGDKMVVSGKLDLPQGTFYLIEQNDLLKNKVIDSLSTPNGSFNFKVNPNPISSFYSLVFYDLNRVKYEFYFKTSRLYNGGPWISQNFMADDSILILGNLKPFNPKDFKLPDYLNLKMYSLEQPIKAGKQTDAMYSISYDFSKPVTDSTFKNLEDLTKKYDYSYYLITEIKKAYRNFSKSQLTTLLSGFNDEIKQSNIYTDLVKRIPSMNEYKITSTEMENPSGNLLKFDFSHSKINMVVLWASWCGPCRTEIPELKKIYQKFKNNPDYNIVSISLDEKKEEWLTALEKEAMPWEQLLLPLALKPDQYDIFQFDGSIPTTFFFDNKGVLIDKSIGYDRNLYKTYSSIISNKIK